MRKEMHSAHLLNVYIIFIYQKSSHDIFKLFETGHKDKQNNVKLLNFLFHRKSFFLSRKSFSGIFVV